jgi:hypothetical protein
MTRFAPLMTLMALVIGTVGGCGNAVPPSGAQLVHLVATASEVQLNPATVHAGDVYVELDDPADGGSFGFVGEALTGGLPGTIGPLTDTILERLAHGDTEGSAMSSVGPSCTGPQGVDRGHLSQPGVCGDVFKLVLVAGKYAILGPGWTEMQVEPSVNPTVPPSGPVLPPTMAVLVVLP